MIRWLKVDPKLSEIDLRDYYWISRDQLSSSISGSSLIPSHIRALSRKLIDHGSGSILAACISSEMPKSELEQQMLFALLEKELVKAPDNDKIHKIFIELMAQKINDSVQLYIKAISQVDHEKVPFSLRNELQSAKKKNVLVQTAINAFRKDTQIGRALKQE